MKNKRKGRRHKIELDVHVEAKSACALVDVSQTGARLALRDSRNLPIEFLLVFGADLRRWCRVKWRSKTQVGVQFIAPPEDDNKVLV